MTDLNPFPEMGESKDALFPSILKAAAGPPPDDPADPYTSVTDAFIRYCSTRNDLKPLSRALAKDRELRDALYKALDAEGAFDLSNC
jgi:hypothetical protein